MKMKTQSSFSKFGEDRTLKKRSRVLIGVLCCGRQAKLDNEANAVREARVALRWGIVSMRATWVAARLQCDKAERALEAMTWREAAASPQKASAWAAGGARHSGGDAAAASSASFTPERRPRGHQPSDTVVSKPCRLSFKRRTLRPLDSMETPRTRQNEH